MEDTVLWASQEGQAAETKLRHLWQEPQLFLRALRDFKSTSSDGPKVVGSTAGPPEVRAEAYLGSTWLAANLGRSSDRCSSKDSGNVS